MVICCVIKRKRTYIQSEEYKDIESFAKDYPQARVMWAFNEDDDILKGKAFYKGKYIPEPKIN